MFGKTSLDKVLLDLAGPFETGGGFWYTPDAAKSEETQACLAELVAEGSVVREGAGAFQFSIIGYAKYIPRLSALRETSWVQSYSTGN